MKEHLTLVLDPFQSANHALKETVDGMSQVLGMAVRTVIVDAPFDALDCNEADMAIVDPTMAKDQLQPNLVIAATLRRFPGRDRTLSRHGGLHPTLANPFGISNSARVGVTSLRQVGPLRTCCKSQVSVVTEACTDPLDAINKGDFDAFVLSDTEFHRTALDGERFAALALRHEVMLPAPGNGAFALVAGADSPHLHRLSGLHDPSTERCTSAEFELQRLLGSEGPALGCRARETTDGAIHLAACLTRADADCRTARAVRVASVTVDPHEAAHFCIAAFHEIEPGQGDILLT